MDLACGQTDLIAIGGVARGRSGHDFALWQFSGQRLVERGGRISGAGDAHRLIHIAASGEGIADGPADAGGRTAERLDLRGVVMRFVFEQEQPFLILTIDVDGGLHRAGVDLLGLIQVAQHAGGL